MLTTQTEWPALFAPDHKGDVAVLEVGIDEPLGQLVPAMRFFVRDCYRALERRIWDAFQIGKRATICLTGTPGIGKSMFGLYFLHKLVRFLKASAASAEKLAAFGLGLNGMIVNEHVSNVRDATSPTFYIIDAIGDTIHTYDGAPHAIAARPSHVPREGRALRQHRRFVLRAVGILSPGGFLPEGRYGETLILPLWDADELVECWRRGCAVICPLPDVARKSR
jgi:hypothetical protein